MCKTGDTNTHLFAKLTCGNEHECLEAAPQVTPACGCGRHMSRCEDAVEGGEQVGQGLATAGARPALSALFV